MIACLGTETGEISPGVFTQFRRLAEDGVVPDVAPRGHKDGWGVIAYDQSGSLVISQEKGGGSALEDEAYARAIDKAQNCRPSLVLAHLRKTTPGLEISMENVHPYTHEQFSFCHNGWVAGFQEDLFVLDEAHKPLRKGTNDSEHLFLRLVQDLKNDQPHDLKKLFTQFVHRLRNVEHRSFISLFSDGRTLVACREVNENEESMKVTPHEVDQYYSFYIGKDESGRMHMACSEPLPVPGIVWELLSNHSIASIDLKSRTMEVARV